MNKVIEYLEKPNVKLWIITAGYGPWDAMFPLKYRSKWFIIKRGHRWNEIYKKYNDHWKGYKNSIFTELLTYKTII